MDSKEIIKVLKSYIFDIPLDEKNLNEFRTKAYRRHMNKQKLNHKLSIIKDIFDKDDYEFLIKHPRRLGQLIKGKVHCSCPMCSSKTKNFGLPIRDQRKKGFIKEGGEE